MTESEPPLPPQSQLPPPTPTTTFTSPTPDVYDFLGLNNANAEFENTQLRFRKRGANSTHNVHVNTFANDDLTPLAEHFVAAIATAHEDTKHTVGKRIILLVDTESTVSSKRKIQYYIATMFDIKPMDMFLRMDLLLHDIASHSNIELRTTTRSLPKSYEMSVGKYAYSDGSNMGADEMTPYSFYNFEKQETNAHRFVFSKGMLFAASYFAIPLYTFMEKPTKYEHLQHSVTERHYHNIIYALISTMMENKIRDDISKSISQIIPERNLQSVLEDVFTVVNREISTMMPMLHPAPKQATTSPAPPGKSVASTQLEFVEIARTSENYKTTTLIFRTGTEEEIVRLSEFLIKPAQDKLDAIRRSTKYALYPKQDNMYKNGSQLSDFDTYKYDHLQLAQEDSDHGRTYQIVFRTSDNTVSPETMFIPVRKVIRKPDLCYFLQKSVYEKTANDKQQMQLTIGRLLYAIVTTEDPITDVMIRSIKNMTSGVTYQFTGIEADTGNLRFMEPDTDTIIIIELEKLNEFWVKHEAHPYVMSVQSSDIRTSSGSNLILHVLTNAGNIAHKSALIDCIVHVFNVTNSVSWSKMYTRVTQLANLLGFSNIASAPSGTKNYNVAVSTTTYPDDSSFSNTSAFKFNHFTNNNNGNYAFVFAAPLANQKQQFMQIPMITFLAGPDKYMALQKTVAQSWLDRILYAVLKSDIELTATVATSIANITSLMAVNIARIELSRIVHTIEERMKTLAKSSQSASLLPPTPAQEQQPLPTPPKEPTLTKSKTTSNDDTLLTIEDEGPSNEYVMTPDAQRPTQYKFELIDIQQSTNAATKQVSTVLIIKEFHKDKAKANNIHTFKMDIEALQNFDHLKSVVGSQMKSDQTKRDKYIDFLKIAHDKTTNNAIKTMIKSWYDDDAHHKLKFLKKSSAPKK